MLRSTLVLSALLASPAFVIAGPREDALELIEKAIRAHGGETGLLKLQNSTRKGEGVMVVANQEQPFTDVLSISLPDRMRHAVEIDRRAKVITVVNGEQGWTQAGSVTTMSKDLREEVNEELYVWALASLVPILKGTYDLAPLPEIKVDDRPALGVRVRSKGRPEAQLYFDKDTQLLVKIARQARLAGAVVEKEYLFRAFREFDGVRLPTRSVESIGGRKFSELKSASYDLRKPDDSQFNRP
jgi:hypothetical protein